MEQTENKNVTKLKKKSAQYTATRITHQAQKLLNNLLTKVNKKDYGKRVKSSVLIELALTLVNETHIKKLQNESLSNADLLEIQFREYIKKNGKISKDDFLGILLKEKSQIISA